MTTNRPLCIYHANCMDGFAAAWVVNRALAGQVDFHKGYYQDITLPELTNRDLIIVDFSYKEEAMRDICQRAKSVLVLDHHKTAQAELANIVYANTKIHFDMNRSGAGMAWDYFFPNASRPLPINMIEDRDLWRFKIIGTREFHAYLSALEMAFDIWDPVMLETNMPVYIESGRMILQKFNKDLTDMLRQGTQMQLVHGCYVPICNLHGIYASEGGNRMLSDGDDRMHLFSVTWFDTAEHRKFSLRSHDAGKDVSLIAAEYGGGGHRNAAGFSLPHGEWPHE